MTLGNVYADKALSQIPRILSMQDRNEFSPSYGCFDRIFWLDKSIDFPSSILQLNTHNLAMAYSYNYEKNPFYKQEKIKKWAIAGLEYWIKIQHKDGSFDEFYPNEKGWAGPTGFLLYSMLSTYDLLEEHFSPSLKERFFESARKAAQFLAKYDEQGILANHHAMALLAIYYTYKRLGDKSLLEAFNEKFLYFRSLQSSEGWLLEYDGADLGYLSASVSFLAKIYKLADDDPSLQQNILEVVEKAIDFSSYFVYPNRYYAGTIGSRQTLHFYTHGYEVFADKFPLARKIADEMLLGLSEGKLVSPEIMPWRYLGYRVQEYLVTYPDYNPVSDESDIQLPHEKAPFMKFFPDARMGAVKTPHYYLVINLAKGGVIKIFNSKGALIHNDCGIIGELSNGKRITNQWIDISYKVNWSESIISVEGPLHYAPFTYPDPWRMIAFRLLLLTIARNTRISYWLKGVIRNLFITRTKKAPGSFKRTIQYGDTGINIKDEIYLSKPYKEVKRISIGDEFSVRFVPQSMYFQFQELDINGFLLNHEQIEKLNHSKQVTIKRKITSN